jgi:uncharacterized protein YgiB involved in biofilm formation
MRLVIIVLIVGIAAAMAYFGLRGECPGGQVFATKTACRDAGLGEILCDRAFAEARRKAFEESSPFSTQDACLHHFPRCERHVRIVSGYVPVPRGVCVVPGKPGNPVFERIGASPGLPPATGNR